MARYMILMSDLDNGTMFHRTQGIGLISGHGNYYKSLILSK